MHPRQFQALLGGVSLVALMTGVAHAQSAAENAVAELQGSGAYLSGDFHNHTTCTDGSMAVNVTVQESLITYGLDWFAQTGHGGEGNRDCRFSDPEYDGAGSGDGNFWVETIGAEGIKGDFEESSGFGARAFFDDPATEDVDGAAQEMWRWQSLIEYAYPMQKQAGELADKPAWLGLEHVAPGHEHVSMAIIERQLRANGNAIAMGQFEYLWDRSDDDTSGGGEFDFENPDNGGVPKIADSDARSEAETGVAGHERAVASVEWLLENFGVQAYYVPAHVERQGGFNPTGTGGWNVDQFRDIHNAGKLKDTSNSRSIAFGAEMLAGHQFANGGRGTYEMDRPSAGLGTYGGAGAYAGAEVAVPGMNFDGGSGVLSNGAGLTVTVPTDGSPLTPESIGDVSAQFAAVFEGRLTEPSGSDQYDELKQPDGGDPIDVFVYGRPGLATMWDALLGEGRRFFVFSNSDWHNRGSFGPFEPESTLDPWPGEYNKTYAYVEGTDFGFSQANAAAIVRGMRVGNSYSVHGDLIEDFFFVMCQGDRCATMGEQLVVDPSGDDVEWAMSLTDPAGVNFSPYTFNNPSLVQIGMEVPMNAPVLSHVDVIRGDVTGEITPDDPEYATNVANQSVELFARIDNLNGEFDVDGEALSAAGVIPAASFTNDMYFRVRGTNMPVGTPNETDADGNPLLDDWSALIPCTAEGEAVEVAETIPTNSGIAARLNTIATFDPSACPAHLPVDANGVKHVDADVEAWADLWFYANPVFIRVQD